MRKDKGVGNGVEPMNVPDEKGTSAVATSTDEILFICKLGSTNLASEECTWVIDSGASFHITLLRECFSTYTTGDHGYVKMGDNGECKIAIIGSVCLKKSTGC